MNDGSATLVDGSDGGDGRARWDARYRARELAQPARGASLPDPPRTLRRMAPLLPAEGRAIDLAGGDGGGGRFLAGRGLDTTVVDVSPIALARAAAFARTEGIDLETVVADLHRCRLSDVLSLVGGAVPAAITCFNYLDRSLLGSIGTDLPSASRFLVAVATTTNRERNRRPARRFLLEPGELEALVVGTGGWRLRVLHRREGWADDRHHAELVVEAR